MLSQRTASSSPAKSRASMHQILAAEFARHTGKRRDGERSA
jgi:hypothetical protein